MQLPRKGSIKTRAKGFLLASGGATAVEFALIAAPFFFLIGTILEAGIMLFTEYRLQSGVDAAARLVRTGQTTVSNAQQFTQALCANAWGIRDCPDRVGFVVESGNRFADINIPEINAIDSTVRLFSPGNPDQAVGIVATVDWTFILPHMRLLGNPPGSATRRLQGVAVFKREPS